MLEQLWPLKSLPQLCSHFLAYPGMALAAERPEPTPMGLWESRKILCNLGQQEASSHVVFTSTAKGGWQRQEWGYPALPPPHYKELGIMPRTERAHKVTRPESTRKSGAKHRIGLFLTSKTTDHRNLCRPALSRQFQKINFNGAINSFGEQRDILRRAECSSGRILKSPILGLSLCSFSWRKHPWI